MLRALGSFGPCSAAYLDVPGMLIAGPEASGKIADVLNSLKSIQYLTIISKSEVSRIAS